MKALHYAPFAQIRPPCYRQFTHINLPPPTPPNHVHLTLPHTGPKSLAHCLKRQMNRSNLKITLALTAPPHCTSEILILAAILGGLISYIYAQVGPSDTSRSIRTPFEGVNWRESDTYVSVKELNSILN